LSSSSGLRRDMTPACCNASMFCGRVASSATVCTNVTLCFWYSSNTLNTARVDIFFGWRVFGESGMHGNTSTP